MPEDEVGSLAEELQLLAVAIGLVLMGPWIISQLTEFIVRTLTSLPQAITGG